jgi:hypothetical protein
MLIERERLKKLRPKHIKKKKRPMQLLLWLRRKEWKLKPQRRH